MEDRQKGERCGIDNCRSRWYYLQDGQWLCSNGHVQEGRLDIQEDEEYQPVKGARRVVTEENEEGGEKATLDKVFTGRKGLSLFLQAYQLILRKQVQWLREHKHFPAEFEAIVRDIWTLRLEAIYTNPSGSSRAESSSGGSRSRSRSAGLSQSQSDTDGRDALHVNEDDETSQTDASQISSQRSLSTLGSQSSRGRGKRRRDTSKDLPKLLHSICICYLAGMLLQLPLDIVTIHGWIMGQELIYVRASKCLPEAIWERLEMRYKRRLEIRALPSVDEVRRAVYKTFRWYQGSSGIEIPKINMSVWLWGYVLKLKCPPEVYPAVKKLAAILGLELKYPTSSSKLRLLDCPDIQIVAMVVIVLKLAFGFDDVHRNPKSMSEIGNLVPEWDNWMENLRETVAHSDDKGISKHGERKEKNWMLTANESDIYGLTEEEMDEYLDWYEKTWASETSTQPTKNIIRLFEDDEDGPAPDTESTFSHQNKGQDARLQRDISAYTKSQVSYTMGDNVRSTESEGLVRPGQRYQRYRSVEELPVRLATLYAAAAEVIGIDITEFMTIIGKLEYKCEKIIKGLQRGSKSAEMEMEVEMETGSEGEEPPLEGEEME